MFSFLITLILVCLIVGLLWWAITKIPLPAPLGTVVQVVFIVVVAIALIGLLFGQYQFPTLRLP